MKPIFLFLYSFNLYAQVGRSPAVIEESCNLDISTIKIVKGSEKISNGLIKHRVIIRSSENDLGCSVLLNNRYPVSVYEENTTNEINILFQKYPEKYIQKCTDHYKKLGLNSNSYNCEIPSISSMTFTNYGCEKQVEDVTNKISYAGYADAEVQYKQNWNLVEEKSVNEVQKEQCDKIKECIKDVDKINLAELNKLSAVACKAELVPISTTKAPELQHDSTFNGDRKPKNNNQKYEQEKKSKETDSVIK